VYERTVGLSLLDGRGMDFGILISRAEGELGALEEVGEGVEGSKSEKTPFALLNSPSRP